MRILLSALYLYYNINLVAENLARVVSTKPSPLTQEDKNYFPFLSLSVSYTWLLAEVHVDVLAAARLRPADGAEGVPRGGQEVQGVWPQGTRIRAEKHTLF